MAGSRRDIDRRVEAVTEFNALWTSLALHEAALMVWASTALPKNALKRTATNADFMIFVTKPILRRIYWPCGRYHLPSQSDYTGQLCLAKSAVVQWTLR